MRDRRPVYVSRSRGGCYYGATARTRASSIVCSLSGRDYDAGRTSILTQLVHDSDREIDTIRNELQSLDSMVPLTYSAFNVCVFVFIFFSFFVIFLSCYF